MDKPKKKVTIKEKPASVDDVFTELKPFGYYQWFLCFVYAYHFVVISTNDGFMIFAGATPSFKCNDPPYANLTPIEGLKKNCQRKENCSAGNFSYVPPGNFTSVIMQWDLVCDKAYFVDLITSLQMAGIFVGALASGPIVDYFGRKWPFLALMTTEIILASVQTLSPSWQMFGAIRFVLGIFTGADLNAGWVFTAEFTTNRWRFLFRALSGIIPSLDFPILAWLTKNWKTFSLIGNLHALPLIPLVAFLTYESPRWLIQKGRRKEAAKVLNKIAKWNRVKGFKITEEDLYFGEDKSKPLEQGHFYKLFSTLTLAKYTFCAVFTWLVAAIINFGMLYDTGNLPFNIYLTNLLLGIMSLVIEIPIAMADTWSLKLNRRLLLLSFFFFCVICNAAVALLFMFAYDSKINQPKAGLGWLFSFWSIAGQCAISIVFDTAYVYQVELFPTLLRSQAGALCSAGARIGGIIAPQLLYLENKWRPIPYICFAVVGFIGFLADWILLPNTKDKVLPEGLNDDLKTFEEKHHEIEGPQYPMHQVGPAENCMGNTKEEKW